MFFSFGVTNDKNKRSCQSDHVARGVDGLLKLTTSHKSQNKRINFIKTLHSILTGNKHSDGIKFSDNKIVVENVSEFPKSVLPSDFEHSDFKRFNKSVMNYSFLLVSQNDKNKRLH